MGPGHRQHVTRLVALGLLLRLADVPVLVVGESVLQRVPGRFPALVNGVLRAFQWSGVSVVGLRLVAFIGRVVSFGVHTVLGEVLVDALSRVHGH